MTAPVPAVQQLGSAVLLRGPAVVDVWRLVALGIRLPAGEDGGELSRPQRRGGARGVYGVRAVS